MAMKGRFHYYEGWSMREVTFPERVMYELGIETLFVSNAAGGMCPDFRIGDLMVITDHINFFPEHPLHGPNFPTGPRFPDMHQVYDPKLIELANTIAEEKNIRLVHGVYVGVQGPTFETPAEYRMYAKLGGQAIGMSTVPEVIVAKHAGLEVAGISFISNKAAGISPTPISHIEVSENAAKAEKQFSALMARFIELVLEGKDE
jgi:inosine guanosine and xanthosine phosphorylase family